ncbi:MAG: LysR family transcriptional regulator [Hyphomonadaceae bacterium]|nr:LysR family transcriptional regulator [Hyphomonadaceae bacterium]
MTLAAISLNALRAFEASARLLSFTRAGEELCVTQAAVSHQIKALEAQLGVQLFRRTTRGLVLTDEGAALAPSLAEAFARIERALEELSQGKPREVLTIGVVSGFALGFLLERLKDFRLRHPFVDLRLLTNNNKVDLYGESLDGAIRFGDGAWRGVEAMRLLDAPMSPLVSADLAAQLRTPADLARIPLLRSYRVQDWPSWLEAAGCGHITARGPMFDASHLMVQAALLGEGAALAPPSMFRRELASGRLVQPFALETSVGAYWLTRLLSKPATPAYTAFGDWLRDQCAAA